jgi:hypothetical protein
MLRDTINRDSMKKNLEDNKYSSLPTPAKERDKPDAFC